MKTYALVRPDGVVQQFIESCDEELPATLDGLEVVEYEGKIRHGLMYSEGAFFSPEALPSAPISDEVLALRVRAQRSAAIAASDWTQLPDNALTAAQKSAWANYRQALRDLPQQSGFPHVAFPAAPSF
ncbi:hypothetical protein DBR47_00610 [Paucibacter sp. KBW04]|uniref:tail fiber assembly protein n=1 Tax=Paucibacter sp. KBW04 TaxID=2153361 RepID=UPI000F55BF7F|nr:tail fiber assembly protein [Paucibacter sp. KBW04]RQO63108.1 hypothetical protein DBR47_00610 [Paucibacter sp. KBW04]